MGGCGRWAFLRIAAKCDLFEAMPKTANPTRTSWERKLTSLQDAWLHFVEAQNLRTIGYLRQSAHDSSTLILTSRYMAMGA